MKTFSKLVVGAMVALAFTFTACSGTGTGTGDNLTPITVSTPELQDLLPNRATFTFKVTGDAERVTGVCETLDGTTTAWHDERDALTQDGVTYTFVAGGGTDPLLPDTEYAFYGRGYDANGKTKNGAIRFRTPPIKPVDAKWEFLLSADGPQGEYTQVPPPGKETNPDWNWVGHVGLAEIPTFGKVIGPFGDAGQQPFNFETLKIEGSAVDGMVYPCKSEVLMLWPAEVKQKVDAFNGDHGACRAGLKWRIEYLIGVPGDQLTELFEH